MPDELAGTIRKLDFPFTVSPSGGDLAVFGQEERFNVYGIVCGYSPSLYADDRVTCVALITVRSVIQYIVGYPNEDAIWSDPRGEMGHGVYEIVGSSWRDSIDAYNNASFGTDYPGPAGAVRHFFIGSKDTSAQFLAKEIDLEVIRGRSLHDAYTDARQEALNRLDSYPEP